MRGVFINNDFSVTLFANRYGELLIPAFQIIPVILCGGLGARLRMNQCPPHKAHLPKQFCALATERSVLQDTIERALYCTDTDPSDIIIVTSSQYKDITEKQVKEISGSATHRLLCEPEPKNTAAAIAYAALYAKNSFSNDILLWVLPSDHKILDVEPLKKTLRRATKVTGNDFITTFGITPTKANTQYGYIKTDAQIENSTLHHVQEFVEKPDEETARAYCESNAYLWNSGMFLASPQTLITEYKKHMPSLFESIRHSVFTPDALKNAYASIEAISFDVGIMEKTSQALVAPCDINWEDLGSWENLPKEIQDKLKE